MIKKTFSGKPIDVKRTWYELDASNQVVGRLAVQAAKLLIGKQKVNYTPHVDGGDFVIITNASKVKLTGRKSEESHHHYSGYPGGLKSTTKQNILEQNPAKLIELAVYGMIPKNKLRSDRMARLRVFASSEHEHGAQKPKKVEI